MCAAKEKRSDGMNVAVVVVAIINKGKRLLTSGFYCFTFYFFFFRFFFALHLLKFFWCAVAVALRFACHFSLSFAF